MLKKNIKKQLTKTSLENEFISKKMYFETQLKNIKTDDERFKLTQELYNYYHKNFELFNNYYNDSSKKATIYNSYMDLNTYNYIKSDEDKNMNIQFCNSCNVQKYFCNIDSVLICPKCSEQTSILTESEKPSFKDPPSNNNFNYQREEHFKDCLKRMQAKEPTKIDDNVEYVIYYEFFKEHDNKNLADLNEEMVRKYLKYYIHLGYNKYYENAQQIINKLTKIKPLDIPENRIKLLIALFKIIERAFIKHCPENKYNLISYPFIIYKEFQILGYLEYIPYCMLTKINNADVEQYSLWKKICLEEDLPYYSF